ncbi:TetR/AcrR family transcriptional regulator [Reichenbachiella ulvae]|uniref:TetR/AcrR family transcriptional regulator n=1 Tax=Reichenbachiella ulvae TaxID=2980104 RepID=A0ABT3CU96_9BACT|nr:TetR/AcrR family transcriptional regulator [Reichenbachiella ulvae]MCV9387267.1 TetR/AcrR family transcriptional regulator [Reichenbachiella ulvae]
MQGDKKKAILKSALELINEQGFHGTSMSHLAKHANVAAGTIYHYFDSKEAMICAVHTHIVDRVLDQLALTDDPTLPYKERYYRIWFSMYEFHVDNPMFLRFYEQFVNSPYFFNNTSRMRISDFYHELLKEGIEKGHLAKQNPEILASLFIGGIISALKMTLYKKMKLSREDLTDIIDMHWKGMSK